MSEQQVKQQLKDRTKTFALGIMRLLDALPKRRSAAVIRIATKRIQSLHDKADQIVAMVVASIRTDRRGIKKR